MGTRGHARERGDRGPSLEDRLIRIAEDRVQVIPCPDVVIADAVGENGGGAEVLPRGCLAEEKDAELHGARLPAVVRASTDHQAAPSGMGWLSGVRRSVARRTPARMTTPPTSWSGCGRSPRETTAIPRVRTGTKYDVIAPTPAP